MGLGTRLGRGMTADTAQTKKTLWGVGSGHETKNIYEYENQEAGITLGSFHVNSTQNKADPFRF